MWFHPYVLFFFQIILITVFAYSYGQELVNYSLLIIYGGGVMVLYIIFLIFNSIYEYRVIYKQKNSFFSRFSFFFCFVVGLFIGIIISSREGLVENSKNYEFINVDQKGTFISWVLNNMFLGANIYNLILIGFFLCIVIFYIVKLLKK